MVPVLAILTGLLFSAVFIILTSEEVYNAFGRSIWAGLSASWRCVARAYGALFAGSLGQPSEIVAALRSGDEQAIRHAFYPVLESLTTSVPYVFAGLAVALSFRSGVFNIGAEGQIYMGALTSAFIGYAVIGLPAIVHIPVALLAGALGGAIWGFIPGWLKARTGAHEVISTIMLNYVAFRLCEWLLSGPMKRPGTANQASPVVQETARLPCFFGDPIRFHLGFFVALAAAWAVSWLLFRTTWGFSLRVAGANPDAARCAGINVSRSIVVAMTLSGALAGIAGANEVLGVNHHMAMAFSSGYGFDAIALALLGNNSPLGVVLAALLFGTLRNGATNMQVASSVPVDIISILQGTILVFIAAPAIIRGVYRLRLPEKPATEVTIRGWGGS